jgi:hypothetical protein
LTAPGRRPCCARPADVRTSFGRRPPKAAARREPGKRPLAGSSRDGSDRTRTRDLRRDSWASRLAVDRH